MARASTLIFDFDGTLADTFGIATDLFRKYAAKSHPTDAAAIERLRGMSASQVIKSLGISWWRLPYFVYVGRKAVNDRIDEVHPYPGLSEVVRKLHAKGYKLLVVSSNSSKNIHRFLQNNKLESEFSGVYGGSGLFSKAATLTNIMRKNGLKPASCRYIGDEARDVDAARKAGIPCVSVTWGYNNHAALESAKAETLVDTPAGLLKVLA